MIYLIDFNGCSRGWYNRSEIQVSHVNGRLVQFTDGQILWDGDPDLEAFATIAEPQELANFVPVRIDDVQAGRFSVEAMKRLKHYILIENTWVLLALCKKVHADCFELSFGGGQRLWTHGFGMGEPEEKMEEGDY